MTNDNAPLLEFRDVGFAYRGPQVLEHIDLTVHPGDFIGIIGPSGSGKTTLLRLVLGSLQATSGDIRRAADLRLSYVPQLETVDWNFPITVEEVVLMASPGSWRRPWSTAAERRSVGAVLEQLGLAGLEDRHIRDLSGGQQQRVFLARALHARPQLLVLDEPTSGVDVRTRHEVVHLLNDLHHDGMTVVLTTHDLNGLAAHLPSVACLHHSIVAAGPPREVLTPSVLEATFGAPMSVLEHGGMLVVADTPLVTR